MEVLYRALEKNGIYAIADFIGLHPNTVKRWLDNDRVPNQYAGDLGRMVGEPPEHQDIAQKNQYYTSNQAAKNCFDIFKKTAESLGVNLDQYIFIEPSAGCGGFYDLLPQNKRIGIDIDPQCDNLIKQDYLTWTPNKDDKYAVIGNPPFGLRGHLALQFINHSANFADMVAFILPPLFNSDGKGVPAKRVRGYKLAHTSPMPADSFFYPDGKPVSVTSIFQVWTRIGTEKIKIKLPPTCNEYIKVYSLSDGGTPASTRNKKMLYKCDLYLPSTCFNGMRVYQNFEDLPHRRGYGIVIKRDKVEIETLLNNANWEEIAFTSTNGALNLRTSIIASVVTNRGFIDNEQFTF